MPDIKKIAIYCNLNKIRIVNDIYVYIKVTEIIH